MHSQTCSRKILSVFMAIVMVVSLQVPTMAFAAEGSGGGGESSGSQVLTLGGMQPSSVSDAVRGGDTITEDGSYTLADDATGTITIGDNLEVELVGNKWDSENQTFVDTPYKDLTIEVGNGTTLTITDVYIDATENAASSINFLTTGELYISGHNLFDRSIGYGSNSSIHVGPAADVTFDGDGVLYMYKHAQGAGIGADGNETNGKITFNGGTWFIKGSKTGALIGTDTVKGGDVIINGGTFYLKGVAQGAIIGTSRMGTAGPDVTINGGLIQIATDFSGSAIGYGGQKAGDPGTLTVNGGSLMTIITPNAYSSWGYGSKTLTDGAFISADNVTAAHESVSMLVFDAADYATGEVNVTFDDADKPFYKGGLYTYIENEVKNPPQQSTPSTEYANKKSDTLHNWVPNTQDYLLSAEDYSGAYPTVYGSALAGTSALCFWITEEDHTMDVNGDTYNVTWDADAEEFTYEKVQVYKWYEDGGAAEGESYTISTAEELAEFATLVNGTVPAGYPYVQDTFKDKTVTLSDDIDLSDIADWTPIGGDYKTTEITISSQEELVQAVNEHGIIYDDLGNSYTNSPNGNDNPYSASRTYYYMMGGVFEGTFDGAGKAITGMSITSGAGVGFRGLFGNNAGTIKDFTISGSIGKADTHIAGGNKDNWGGVAAYNTGTVSGIISKVEMYIDGGEAIGGIVGRNWDGTVEKCGYEGKIDCGISNALSYRAGGIVGNTRGENSLVTLCYNKAFVSAACYSNGMRGVGGIVGSMGNNSGGGENGGLVSFCYNTGDITAGGYGGGKQGTGGIVGAINAGDVANCYSVGTATGPGSAGVIIGKLGKGSYDHLYMLDTARAYQPYGTKTETEGEHANQKYADGTDENADGSIKFSGAALANSYNSGYTITNSWVKTDEELKSHEVIDEFNTLKDETTFEGFQFSCGSYPVLIWEEAAEHTWDEGAVTTEPTADAAGVMTYTCSVCGVTKTAAIYRVTFDANGGTLDGDAYVDVLEGESVESPGDPAWDDCHAFGEWQLDGEAYEFGAPVTAPTKLTATWTEGHTWRTTFEDEDFCEVCGSYNPEAATYHIDDPKYLAEIARAVNAGDSLVGKTVVLEDDIDLSGYADWTPIGNAATAFAGTFDGAGKAISGLAITSGGNYKGLFGNNAGTVKDFSIDGSISVSTSGDFYGAVAGFNSGTIEDVMSTVNISATRVYNMGGIAGLNTSGIWVNGSGAKQEIEGAVGLIQRCGWEGTELKAANKVGGIVGENAGRVFECYSGTGTISAPGSGKGGAGGIVGRNGCNNTAHETGFVDSCYSLATVGSSGDRWFGGIVGFQNYNYGVSGKSPVSSTSNCYFAGTIVSGYSSNWGPIVGNPDGGSIPDIGSNNYSLEGLNSGATSEIVKGIVKTEAELKSKGMVDLLNGSEGTSFQFSCDSYPVLHWQEAQDHEWDEGVVTTEPTVGTEGVKTYTCTRDSNHTKTEVLPKVDPAPLEDAIKAAQDAEEDVETSADGSDVDPSEQWTTPAEKKALDDAIAAAQKVAFDPAATQNDVDAAKKAVDAAKDAYNKAKKAGKKVTPPVVDPIDISKAKIAEVADKTYTGKAYKPTPAVTLNGKTLVNGTDYTLSYKANKKVGTATITATGKGAYTGSVKTTFLILPGKTKAKTVASYKNKTLKVSFAKVAGATDYVVAYRQVGESKWTTRLTKGKTSYTIKNMKVRGLYEVKVAAKGGKVQGKWSNICKRYFYRVSNFKVASGKSKVTATWTVDKKATRYQVRYATSKDMKKNLKTIEVPDAKTAKQVVKNLKKNKTYYVQVRPYKTYQGKTYVGILTKRSAKVK